MEVTDYFRRNVLQNPDRSGITREMCERVVESAGHTVRQPNGRFAFWGRQEGRSCTSGWSSRETVGLCTTPFSTPALPASREGESMKVSYFPDTDSLFVKLKPGLEAEGSEVAPGIVFHYTSEGEVTAIDIDSKASKLVDLSLLEVEGLPISATQGRPQESRAG